ncbi:MAG: methylmalonyl-CoA epimerase [Candidatus Abyssobacteria bacterium SURF_5]|uniref:Methylmalonyl-CoA epimerase n=1 Tax=Abyssobacteria bacterium (strain SURF_5) TaxID=2093360 RepID=A0A3A4NKW5_ABYX5|nr:MAG: methylmalonyl-CoA epimerase [Candidatus Abyssubacteria bacterium SURF_5]
MIRKLDHIGIAVSNLEDALKLYRDMLGLNVEHVEDFEGMKIAFIPIGDTEFELLQPTDPQGALAKFLEKRGEGIQHIAVQVDDVEKSLEELKAKGLQVIDQKPRPGAGGARIAFFHPKSTKGVLLEICQRD